MPAPENQMIELPLIHFDCKHFMGDRPCFANKQYGIFCNKCDYYEKDNTIKNSFPEIPVAGLCNNKRGIKKIIIVKLDAVGDVLRTTSILSSLKSIYPEASIKWITKQKSFDVLKNNKMIDEIYFDNDKQGRAYSETFDIAINLDTGNDSCLIMNKITAVEKFGYTLAYKKPYPLNSLANEWYLMGVDDNFKKQNQKTYHRLIHEICGIEYNYSKPVLEITENNRITAACIRDKLGIHNYGEFILVNLGGGSRWQYKKWTKEGYAELIDKLSYEKPNTAVGVVAGEEDIEFHNEILLLINKRDNVFLLGCENSTDDFISIIYLANKIFTSDSLAFHVATALEKYVVVIVGPTSYSELDVFGNGHILYSSKVDCLACYLNKCDKTVTCMNTINAGEVINYLL
jgi:heptosyltransferase-2